MSETAIFLLILGADSRTIAHKSTLLEISYYDGATILTDGFMYSHPDYEIDWLALYE